MVELLDKPLFAFEVQDIGKILVGRLKTTDFYKISEKFPRIKQSPPDKVVREVFIRTAHHPDDLTEKGFLQGEKYIPRSKAQKISKEDLEKWASKFVECKGNGLLDTEPIIIRTKGKTKKIEPKSYERKEGETSISFLHRIICDLVESSKKEAEKLSEKAMGPAKQVMEIYKKNVAPLERFQKMINPYKDLMDSAYGDLDRIQKMIDNAHLVTPKEDFEIPEIPPIDEKATIKWTNRQLESLNKRIDEQIQIQQAQTDVLKKIIKRLSSIIPILTLIVATLTLIGTIDVDRLNQNFHKILVFFNEDHQEINSNKEKIDKIIKSNPPDTKEKTEPSSKKDSLSQSQP